MLILAIDPGANGAIAMMCDCHRGNPVCIKMPTERQELREVLSGITATATLSHGRVVAYVEHIATAAFGDKSPATISTLNRHVGHLEMALDVADIKFNEVHPRTWQKTIGPLPKDYQERKRATRDKMADAFPYNKVTLWSADALAILHWALEQERP